MTPAGRSILDVPSVSKNLEAALRTYLDGPHDVPFDLVFTPGRPPPRHTHTQARTHTATHHCGNCSVLSIAAVLHIYTVVL